MHAYTTEVSARKSWQAGRQKNLNFTTKALVHVSGSMLSEQIIHSTFSPELLLIIAHSHALLIFFYLFKRLKLVNSKDKVFTWTKCSELDVAAIIRKCAYLQPFSFWNDLFHQKNVIHIRSVTQTSIVERR